MRIDPAMFNIISETFTAIANEMSADLLRSAYSTVIREAADFSTFLANGEGKIIAQANNNPLHMNSVSPAMEGALKEIDINQLTEDDVIVLNDAYSGGQHLSDIYFFSPIIWDDKIVAFAGSVGHHPDLGHSPGFYLHARDVYQERMRFTPMKFSISQDWNGGILEQLIRSNVRIPRDTIGDLNAQLTANQTGRQRFKELILRYGIETVNETERQFLEYTEKIMRQSIESLPDGEYTAEEKGDGDGLTDEPIIIRVKLIVSGDKLQIDFTGTSPQVKTAINCPWASTISSTFSVLKMLLTDPMLPLNDGSYRPITIIAPKGCIVNPREFAPVEGRNVIVMRIFQSILKALAQALPGQVPSPGFDTRTEINFQWSGAQFYAISEQLGGGYGAGPKNDGADQLDDPLGNCRNTPVEALETVQPFMRVLRYELRPDSGGAGKSRGGLGAVRTYEILKDNVHGSIYSDRFKYPATGLYGGNDGTCAYLKLIRQEGDVSFLPPKGDFELNCGDILEVGIGGGAGYGNPLERDRELVARDLNTRKILTETAKLIYGYKPKEA